jgi:dihydroceramidase
MQSPRTCMPLSVLFFRWLSPQLNTIQHSAEFYNSISNLFFIVPSVLALMNFRHTALPARYVGSYLGLLLVGIGSTCFHATLKWEMQLLDELPM